MTLVEERNSWKAELDRCGYIDLHLLEQYRENRESELWRASRQGERLCEYILWLEELVANYSKHSS